MPKEKQIELDALPAPGEPLIEDIHADNQAALDEDLRDKLALLSGKIKPRELRRLNRRQAQLVRRLTKAGYNDLVKERWRIKLELDKVKAQFDTAKGKRRESLRARGLQLTAAGRDTQAFISKLRPLNDELESIGRRLRGHEIAVAYELEDKQNAAALDSEARTWERQLYAAFKQNGRINHKGTDRQGKPFVDTPIISRIKISDDRIFYQIRITYQSLFLRFLNRYRSALPEDVDVVDLTHPETLETLSAHCGRVVTVARGQRDQSLWYVVSRLDSPDGIPSRVLYSKVIQWYPVKDHALTPWMAGVTNDRKAESFNLEKNPHILIAGSTQSGKSNLLNGIIATFVTMNTPAELLLVLIDNKGGVEFTHWDGINHALMPMIKKASGVLPALEQLRELMHRRFAALESIKAKNFLAFNAKVDSAHKWPRIVCVLDEMATLLGLGDETTAIQDVIRDLVSMGRAVGLHMIVCTQHVSVDVLPGWIKTNMTLRVSGKMPSDTASRVILDTGTAVSLPAIPGRMVYSVGRFEIIAQAPFITDDEIARAVEKSQKDAPANLAELTAAAPIVAREKITREDVIELALYQFAGKLSPSKMHEYLGDDSPGERAFKKIINDDIVPRGQIEHEGQLYKIGKIGKSHILKPIADRTRERTQTAVYDDSLDTSYLPTDAAAD